MIYCPLCWAEAKCIDSRCHPLTNTIRRRRVCTHCAHRFTSVEIVLGGFDPRVEKGDSARLKLAREIFDVYKEYLGYGSTDK